MGHIFCGRARRAWDYLRLHSVVSRLYALSELGSSSALGRHVTVLIGSPVVPGKKKGVRGCHPAFYVIRLNPCFWGRGGGGGARLDPAYAPGPPIFYLPTYLPSPVQFSPVPHSFINSIHFSLCKNTKNTHTHTPQDVLNMPPTLPSAQDPHEASERAGTEKVHVDLRQTEPVDPPMWGFGRWRWRWGRGTGDGRGGC